MCILPVSHKQNTLKTPKNNSKLMNYTNSPLTLKSDTVNFAFKGQNRSGLNLSTVLDLLTKPDESKRNSLFYADFDEIEQYNRVLGDGAPVIFQVATLAQDKNKQNVIHKLFIDTLKTYADEIGNFDYQEIMRADSMQDIYDKCSFDFQTPLKMEKLSSVLKDKSPETIEKALLTQDKYGRTPLHFANIYNLSTCKKLYGFTDIRNVSLSAIMGNKNEDNPLNKACADLIYSIADSLGDKAPEVFAKAITIQDKEGNTSLHSISKEALEAIIDVLDDSASEALAQATLIPNKSGVTPWFNAREGVTNLYIEALSDRACDVVKSALSKNNSGINLLSSATLEQLNIYKKALGKNAKECFEGLMSDKNSIRKYFRHSNAEKIDFLANVLEEDAPQMFKEAVLSLKFGDTVFCGMPYLIVKSILQGLGDEAADTVEKVFEIEGSTAHLLANSSPESINLYSDTLGKEKSSEVFEKAMLKKSKQGFNPLHLISYPEQIEAISYVLGDRRKEVFEKAMLQKNKNGVNPLQYIINPEVLVAIEDVLEDKSYDVFKKAALNQNKYGTNVFFHVSSQKLDFLIDVFGDDALEIIKEGLLARDKKGNSMLSYATRGEKELYKKYFGDEYVKIEKEALKPLSLFDRIFKKNN